LDVAALPGGNVKGEKQIGLKTQLNVILHREGSEGSGEDFFGTGGRERDFFISGTTTSSFLVHRVRTPSKAPPFTEMVTGVKITIMKLVSKASSE